MTNFPWTCPFCGSHTTITDPNYDSGGVRVYTDLSEYGKIGFHYFAISCPNQSCKKLSFKLSMGKWNVSRTEVVTPVLHSWDLLPESAAKPQPDYIPKAIREDYVEACRIRDLSPKASATLARRCLQGMIVDFWKVKDKPNLFQEIEAIKDKVDTNVWEAIDAVRQLGNIGAHMKKDVNLIVKIDQNEAQILINLIETLLEDWYVASKEREERIARVKPIIESKNSQQSAESSEENKNALVSEEPAPDQDSESD